MAENPITILFMCVANSARSQMAESLAKHLAPQGVTVFSAGSEPSTVNPFAVRALEEIGLNADAQYSKSIAEVPMAEVDYLITLCAEEVCPIGPGNLTRLHWPYPDPAGNAQSDSAALARFRGVRDALKDRIGTFFKEDLRA